MKYIKLSIPDVVRIEPQVFGDHRGYFLETFRQDTFSKNIGAYTFVQDNHSKSSKGILRGLHYQIKQPQGKLVRVTSGKVFDVAVDLRKYSNYFGKWVGELLSEENKNMLWIPPGFAHGFYVISETAEFSYKCTDYYAPEYERIILWNDPQIAIDWPIMDQSIVDRQIDDVAPILSEKDVAPILSKKDENGLPFALAEVFA